MTKKSVLRLKRDAAFKELQCREPGVYADWAAPEYHTDEAYSASTGRNLIVGPTYCWQNRWGQIERPSTDAQIEGTAYHTRILEGPEVFAKRYPMPPSRADYPEAIDGGREFTQALGELGLKKSGTIAEQMQRLRDAGSEFKGKFWSDIMDRWRADHPGAMKLSPELIAKIELAAQICAMHPDIGEVWKVGKPEVSICYLSASGMPCRVRMDWLRPGEIIDLKTIANQMKNPMNVQAARTIVGEFYHVQAFNYVEALEQALLMPADMWHGFTAGEVAAHKATREEQGRPADFRFLFIGKAAPDIVQRILAEEVPIDFAQWPDGREVQDVPREPSEVWRSARNIHEHVTARFAHFWKLYGRKPWYDRAGAIGLTNSHPGISTAALSRESELEEFNHG